MPAEANTLLESCGRNGPRGLGLLLHEEFTYASHIYSSEREARGDIAKQPCPRIHYPHALLGHAKRGAAVMVRFGLTLK
jgi:hypothetical protein